MGGLRGLNRHGGMSGDRSGNMGRYMKRGGRRGLNRHGGMSGGTY